MTSHKVDMECDVMPRVERATSSLVLGILSIVCIGPLFFIGLPVE